MYKIVFSERLLENEHLEKKTPCSPLKNSSGSIKFVVSEKLCWEK